MIQPEKQYKLSEKTIAKYYELKSQGKITQRKLSAAMNVSPPVTSKLLNNKVIIKENAADYIHAMKLGAEIGIDAKDILTEID